MVIVVLVVIVIVIGNTAVVGGEKEKERIAVEVDGVLYFWLNFAVIF